MPEQNQPGDEQKAPAVPVPAAVPAPAAPPAASPGLTADEERQLGELTARRDAAAVGGETVRLKVERPHASMRFGAHVVRETWTEVPAAAEPHIMNAAASAGVTITREG